MTEAEQWKEINYPTFFGAVGHRIVAAKNAMDAVPVAPGAVDDWLETNVNNVPILWREEGEDCYLMVGKKDNGEPFYRLTMPYKWMTA